MNKKAFAPALIIPIAIAAVIILSVIAFMASYELRYTIIGGGIIVLTIMYVIPAAITGYFTKNKMTLILIMIFIGMFIIFIPQLGLIQQEALTNEKEQLAIPHMASYKCEKIGSAPGLVYEIPASGIYINGVSIGFWAPELRNIRLEVPYSFMKMLTKDVRVRYKLCSSTGCSEKSKIYSTIFQLGVDELLVDSLNTAEGETLTVWFEEAGILWGNWKGTTGAKIHYDAEKYGITLSSTTRDPAGAKVCLTSCDLTCLPQASREKLVVTESMILKPEETAPYLEYWESINYDLNKQGGATVYNSGTDKFCLGGAIYKAGRLEMDNGMIYIYPKDFIETKLCCPGANIAITNGYKICNSDYTWKEITPDTNIKCISDVNCPGAGLDTCTLIAGKYYKSSWGCNSNKVCVQAKNEEVPCCPVAQGCLKDEICQDNKCVGGAVFGIPIVPTNDENNTQIECKWYQDPVDKQVITKSWYNYIGIGKPTITSEKSCRNWIGPYLILGFFAALLITYLVIAYKPKKRRK